MRSIHTIIATILVLLALWSRNAQAGEKELRCSSFALRDNEDQVTNELLSALEKACLAKGSLTATQRNSLRARGDALLARIVAGGLLADLGTGSDTGTTPAPSGKCLDELSSRATAQQHLDRSHLKCLPVTVLPSQPTSSQIVYTFYAPTGTSVLFVHESSVIRPLEIVPGAFVGIMPRMAFFTVIASNPGLSSPFALLESQPQDNSSTLPPTRYAEIRLRVADKNTERALFVNGAYVAHFAGDRDTKLALARARDDQRPIRVDIVHLDDAGSVSVDARMEFAASSMTERPDQPSIHTVDLSKVNRVALVGVTLSPECNGEGLDAGNVAAQVGAFFKVNLSSAKTLDDRYRHLASMISGLRATEGAFRTERGPTGLLSVASDLPNIAGFLWGQGFSEAIQLDMTCTRSSARMHYTLIVRRLRAQEASDAQLLRKDNGGILDVATATATRKEDLRSFLDAPLAQLFDVPHVHFTGTAEGELIDDPQFEVEVQARGPTQLDYRYSRVDENGGSLCEAVATYERFASSSLAPYHVSNVVSATHHIDVSGELAWDSRQLAAPGAANDRVTLRVGPEFDFSQAGRYLLVIRVAERAEDENGDEYQRWSAWTARCVTVKEPSLRLSLATWYMNEVTTSQVRGHELGVALQVLPARPDKFSAVIGGWIGYAFITDALSTRPSWDDLGAPFGANNKWVRHSIQLGPVLNIEYTPGCVGSLSCPDAATHFAIFHQIAPLLNVGIIDVREIDPSLRTFRDATSSKDILPDVDGDIIVTTGLRARLSSRVDLMAGAIVSFSGVDDGLLDVAGIDTVATVRRSERISAGILLGASYAP